MRHIRGKAVVLFEHEGKFLFTQCIEQSTGRRFYIPVGGGIEFGEYSWQAAAREVKEETGEEVKELSLLHISENIFTWNGAAEHEIVFVYSGRFQNEKAHASLRAGLNANGRLIALVWKSKAEIEAGGALLYPPSLHPMVTPN